MIVAEDLTREEKIKMIRELIKRDGYAKHLSDDDMDRMYKGLVAPVGRLVKDARSAIEGFLRRTNR